MEHPLRIWKTKKVKDLLRDFYEFNFVKAGVEPGLGIKLVETAWKKKDDSEEEVLKQEVKKYFDIAKKQAWTGVDEVVLWDLLEFEKAESVLDVGANKLKVLNVLADRYPKIKKFIGIDVTPQYKQFNHPEKSEYYQVDENAESFPIPDNSVDVISIQFVLHHFPDEKSIKKMIQNCKKALSEKGRFFVWEETFENVDDLSELISENEKVGVHTSKNFMSIFNNFTNQEKWEFIIANDWLINVNNEHMQWTGQYKLWDEWLDLIQSEGFILTKKYNLGLRENGQLKQGVHMIGEFKLG